MLQVIPRVKALFGKAESLDAHPELSTPLQAPILGPFIHQAVINLMKIEMEPTQVQPTENSSFSHPKVTQPGNPAALCGKTPRGLEDVHTRNTPERAEMLPAQAAANMPLLRENKPCECAMALPCFHRNITLHSHLGTTAQQSLVGSCSIRCHEVVTMYRALTRSAG